MTPKSVDEGEVGGDEGPRQKRAMLVLQDGTIYNGISFGAHISIDGEVMLSLSF